MQKWAKVDEIKVEVGLIRANMMYHKGRGFESRHRFESTAASITKKEILVFTHNIVWTDVQLENKTEILSNIILKFLVGPAV